MFFGRCAKNHPHENVHTCYFVNVVNSKLFCVFLKWFCFGCPKMYARRFQFRRGNNYFIFDSHLFQFPHGGCAFFAFCIIVPFPKFLHLICMLISVEIRNIPNKWNYYYCFINLCFREFGDIGQIDDKREEGERGYWWEVVKSLPKDSRSGRGLGLCSRYHGSFLRKSPYPRIPGIPGTPYPSPRVGRTKYEKWWQGAGGSKSYSCCDGIFADYLKGNFRERNFRENLFSRISQIWKKIANFAKICFCEIFQNVRKKSKKSKKIPKIPKISKKVSKIPKI